MRLIKRFDLLYIDLMRFDGPNPDKGLVERNKNQFKAVMMVTAEVKDEKPSFITSTCCVETR